MQVVGGRTLVQWAASQAERVETINFRPENYGKFRVSWVVNTDDVEIALSVLADEEPGTREHRIHPRRCDSDGPMADVLLDSLGTRDDIEAVLCMQPTSPLRQPDDVIGALRMFVGSGARSLVSINADTGQRNGAIFITRVEMLRDGLVYDEHSLVYPMPAARSLDINEPSDLEEARRILGP